MLVLHFTLEAINLIHILCFVVSAVQKNPTRVEPLISKERHNDLNRPAAAIHEVPIEQEAMGFRRWPSKLEETKKVEELA